MNTKTVHHFILVCMIFLIASCGNSQQKQQQQKLKSEVASLQLMQGELALCGKPEFGTTNFGQTCIKEVRDQFQLAVALLHSFEYEEAEKAFAKVLEADPECVIAYWGIAMSNYHPLWQPPTEAELEKSAKSLELARTLPTKTERESKYIDAISVYYTNWKESDHKTRAKQYAAAMEKLKNENPDDKEAAIFYALALNAVADPTDKTYANQKKAGEILNGIFPGEPNHPGVAHYIIHSYDYPELASMALESARKYAKIAPASAHAQHMPSHIFIRLGLWDEAIQSNLESAESAKCYFENLDKGGHWFNELHALDYLMYAYMQSSQLQKAEELLKYAQEIKEVLPVKNVASGYALAAIPARYPLELKNWQAAATVQRVEANVPWNDYPWESSIIPFTRALGAAHLKDFKAAKAEIEILKANHQKLVELKENYKAGQVNIQIKAAEAWLNFAEGKKDAALKLMTEAADMEDGTSKHPVTPGEVLPARELLGDMYMEMGNYAKALEAYGKSLDKHPKRFNSLYGFGLAMEKTGNKERATELYTMIMRITPNATGTRPELEHAKQYIEKKVS